MGITRLVAALGERVGIVEPGRSYLVLSLDMSPEEEKIWREGLRKSSPADRSVSRPIYTTGAAGTYR